MGLLNRKGLLVLLALVSAASAVPRPIDGQENTWDVGGFTTTLVNGTLTVSGAGSTSAPGEWGDVQIDDYNIHIAEVIFGAGVESVKNFGRSHDWNSSTLVSVTFSEKIKVIKDEAFKDLLDITSITILNPIPPDVQGDPFPGLDKSSVTLYVPSGSVTAYKNDKYWKTFPNIQGIGAGVGIYTVTFDANGGQVTPALSSTDTEGKVADLPTPTRLGYTCIGWFTAAAEGEKVSTSKKFSENTTLYAHWDLVPYRITYDLRYGTLSGTNPEEYTFETETFTLVNPTKDDSEEEPVFAGWTRTSGETPKKIVTIPQGSTGDRNYVANWMPKVTINITTQPQDITLIENEINNAVLRVEANAPEGYKIGYRWYKNTTNSNIDGDTLSNGGTPAYSGASSEAVTIPTSLTAGTYYYFCRLRITDQNNNIIEVRSAVATVTVTPNTAPPGITIRTQPQDTVLIAGKINIKDSIRIAAVVSSNYNAITYRWYRNTTKSNSYRGDSLNTAKGYQSASTKSLKIPDTLKAGTYYYFCRLRATPKAGGTVLEVWSDAAEVLVAKEAVVKKKPEGVEWPSSATVYAGDKLSTAVFEGGVAPYNGTFAYVDGATQLLAENSGTSYAVTFIPKDSVNYYDTLIYDAGVPVTVRKADPIVTWPTSATITYGQSLDDAVLVGNSGSGTFEYTNGSAIKPTVSESGTEYEMTFTPTDAVRYNTLTENVAITVNKKDGSVLFANATPTAGTLTYGQSLSESELSLEDPTVGSWAWENGEIVPTVTNSGYYAIFTPNDKDNYSWAINSKQIVNIIVNKAVPTGYTVPTGLTATYGQHLLEVTFPDNGWSWENEENVVGEVGEQTHQAKFTPDPANYEVATGIPVVVTVEKGTLNHIVPTSLTATYGDKLETVVFPADESGVWSWMTGTDLVGDVGIQTHLAKFMPKDNVHYKETTDIVVSVIVNKADPKDVVWPTSATITYGQTLAAAVFDKQSATGTFAYTIGTIEPKVSESGTLYEVTFTPNDLSNYNKITNTVAITVKKASGLTATNPDPIMVPIANPGPHTFDLSAIGLNKDDYGTLGYNAAGFDDSENILHSEPEITGSTLTYTGAGEESGTATLTVKITSQNYTDVTVTITFKATPKTTVVIGGLTAENSTYDGTPKKGVVGTATSGEYDGELDYIYTGTGITVPTVTPPINAGNYTLTVSVPNTSVSHTGKATYTFTIAKAAVTKPTVTNTSFVYDGSVQTLAIAANANYTVTGNTATIVGDYFATVGLIDKTNYQWADGKIEDISLPWSIVKASYDMTGISFVDKTVNYDGNEHSIEIGGTLPDGVTVSYGDNNVKTAAGTYLVTATFAVDAVNYNVPAPKTATLTIKPTYLITVTGGTSDKGRAAEGETITITANAAATGKLFDTWTATDMNIVNNGVTPTTFVMPAAAVTVMATYKPITYTVIWRTNGGTPAPTDTSVNYGDTIKVPAPMERTGYNFVGWYADTNLTTAASLPMANVTSAKTFYAKWTPTVVTYTITLSAGTGVTGVTISPATVSTGTDGKLASLPTPSRQDYVFEGWYTASSGGTLVQTANNVFTKDTTIYAQWTRIYTVTFNPTGGTITPAAAATAQTGVGGKLTGSLPTPAKTDYTFNGWYTDTTSTPGTKVDTSRVYNANATVYARWTPPVTYTVTFNPTGGTITPATAATAANGKLASLPTPSRGTGYVFNGWYTDTTSTPGTKVDTSRVYNANATVYARWVYTITFNVNSNSGTVSPTSAVTGANGKLDTLPTPTRNNNAFVGWYTTNAATGGTAVTKDYGFSGPTTIYARWTPAYTITFNPGDSGMVSPQTAVTGADGKLASLPTPERTGRTFLGWYTTAAGSTQVTTDYAFTGAATVFARWTSAYTITLSAGTGVTGVTISPATVSTGTDGKLASLPASPSRTNYLFGGWYTESAGGVAVTTSYVFTGNAAIYARWTPVYTITFNSAGGSAVSPALTNANRKLDSLPTPARTGYSFNGWYTDTTSAPGTKVDTSRVYTANATIYARWSSAYTITFNSNGGSAVTPATAVTGAGGKLASLPAPPARSNYAFAGWYTTNAAAGGTEVTTNYVFSANATVFARWTPAYTITFNSNGGSAVTPATSVTGADGKLASLPAPPARSGYSFAGWYTTNAATGGTEVTTNYVFSAAATIYARWTLVTYTITFDANGGTVSVASATTGSGGRLASLPTPAARTGYTFGNWYTAETGGTQVTTSTVFSENATIYARWALVSYTITYNLGGGTADPANPTSYNIESADITLSNPTRTAYIFDGWTGANGTTKQTEVTIQHGSIGAKSYTANWTTVSYTISFDVNGGAKLAQDSAKTAAGGRLSSLPAPSAREGYAFDGWFTASSGGTAVTTSTVFDGDATIYAQWTRIYTVTFDGNGGYLAATTAKTGAGGKLASLPVPTLSGYVCAGWYTAKEGGSQVTTSTVFNGDTVVYARWSQIANAAVTFNAGTNGTLKATVDGAAITSGASVGIGKNVVFSAVPTDGYEVARWTVNGAVVVDNSRTYTLEWLSEPTTVAVSFEWKPVSVAASDREIPIFAVNGESSITPVKTPSGGITVGPNPVRTGGGAAIYWAGGKAVAGELSVFDAAGKRIAVVKVGGTKRIGVWKVGGVAEGAYLIRGVLTDKDGGKIKVSALVGVVR